MSSGLKKKLIATLIYPTILVIAAISIVTYIVTFVLPQFAKLYADMHIDLPLTTRILITVAVDYRPYFIIGFVAILALVVGIYLWSRSENGGLALDKVKLQLPFVGETWIKFQVAQMMRTLSTLLVGGTPLMQALATAAQAAPSRLTADAVRSASQRVREGESFHASLAATKIMPELALEMVEVGEASGSLPAMLNSVAEFYEDEVNNRLSTMVAFIEPAILVVMGCVVAFILISLYLPIFSFGVGTNPGG